MTFEELLFELKRLQSLAEEVSWDLATDLEEVINNHSPAKGDCCG